jgi:GxxExxY protein
MTENELAKIVVDRCIQIHRALGPGLLESVYETVLCHELFLAGLHFERQKCIGLKYKGITMNLGFRADIIVEGKLLVELKSVEALNPVHQKTLLTYLRISDIKLGLLINFHEELLKDGLKRIVNNL